MTENNIGGTDGKSIEKVKLGKKKYHKVGFQCDYHIFGPWMHHSRRPQM